MGLFQDAKDLQLFTAGKDGTTDIETNAEERWKKMRDTFVALQAAQGKLHQSQLGAALREFDLRRRCVIQKVVALWRRQQKKQQRKARAAIKSKEEMLLHQFEHL